MAGLSAGGGAASYISGAFGGGSAGGGAASAGLFANPVGLALAGGQLALSIGSMIAKDKAAGQQAYASAYQTSYQNFMQNHTIRMRNERRKEMFQAKLDMVRDQIANNAEGAQVAYVAEQYRLNEIYDQAAFKQADMMKQLTEAMGASAAREVYGRSAQRGAAVSVMGAYGRTQAQLVAQLMSEQGQSERNLSNIERQVRAANKQALASVSVLPEMETTVGMPSFENFAPSGLSTALQIGSAGMSAFKAGWDVTPKGGSFLGIQKAPDKTTFDFSKLRTA
jgi:hypothetical protein